MSTTMVSQALVRQLLNGAGFFTAFPEFAALQPLLVVRPPVARLCRGCGNSHYAEERIVGAFINILRSLTNSRLQQLKQRANTTTFQFNGYNRLRQATEVMIL